MSYELRPFAPLVLSITLAACGAPGSADQETHADSLAAPGAVASLVSLAVEASAGGESLTAERPR